MRRRFRRSRKQVEGMGAQAEQQIEKLFFKRLTRLFEVRRFVFSWIALIVLLISIVGLQLRSLNALYQDLQPVSGGTYTEGMVGSFTNANPIYASGVVDTTVSRLLFAGLLKYNDTNHLVADLAESWKTSPDGKVYTIILRPNLSWQDGQKLTAADVAFTFQTIKKPDAKSPLFHAWQNVTIATPDERTVTFTLTNPLAPFIYSLTTGIIPKHILDKIEPTQLRSYGFNTNHPVGAGPFKWSTIETIGNSTEANRQNIGLKPSESYHGGMPKLQQFVIKTYTSESQLISGFQKQQVNALVGLDHVPDSLVNAQDVQDYSVPLTAETMTFLRTDSAILKDARIRQALVQAVNPAAIVGGLSYPAIVANGPLLKGQLGYNAALGQLPTNIEAAKKLLDEAGWKQVPNEPFRSNGSAKLKLKFLAANNQDYAYISQQIKKAWQAIGVDAEVTLPSDADLQAAINNREYDALLYGISIGVDPDVFAYWHSTQADVRAPSRLNLSDYTSTVADKALEGERTRLDVGLRVAKYAPFLQAWRGDAPAIALYQPRFLYITRGQVFGYNQKSINTAAERFNNVENWMIRQENTLKSQDP